MLAGGGLRGGRRALILQRPAIAQAFDDADEIGAQQRNVSAASARPADSRLPES